MAPAELVRRASRADQLWRAVPGWRVGAPELLYRAAHVPLESARLAVPLAPWQAAWVRDAAAPLSAVFKLIVGRQPALVKRGSSSRYPPLINVQSANGRNAWSPVGDPGQIEVAVRLAWLVDFRQARVVDHAAVLTNHAASSTVCRTASI